MPVGKTSPPFTVTGVTKLALILSPAFDVALHTFSREVSSSTVPLGSTVGREVAARTESGEGAVGAGGTPEVGLDGVEVGLDGVGWSGGRLRRRSRIGLHGGG